MPRIIVRPAKGPRSNEPRLDEHVGALHLNDDHSAEQLLERLAWAIHDAEVDEADFAEVLSTHNGYLEVSG